MALVALCFCRYHHNAYFAQEVGVVVRQMKPDRFADFVQLIFDHQDSELWTCGFDIIIEGAQQMELLNGAHDPTH